MIHKSGSVFLYMRALFTMDDEKGGIYASFVFPDTASGSHNNFGLQTFPADLVDGCNRFDPATCYYSCGVTNSISRIFMACFSAIFYAVEYSAAPTPSH